MGNNIFFRTNKTIFYKDNESSFYHEIKKEEFDNLYTYSNGEILVLQDKKICFCIESSEAHESGPIDTFQDLML